MEIFIDFESRSPLDIKKCGAYAYAEHPDTEVLCLAVKVDDGDTDIWVPLDFDFRGTALANFRLRELIEAADHIHAHNAGFERCMWTEHMVKRRGFPEIPISKWDDTAARAAMCALPRSLDGATKALGLSAEKDAEGYKLMLKMCRPKALAKKEREALSKSVGMQPEVIQETGKQIMAALKADPRAPERLTKVYSSSYHIFYKYHFTPADFERLCAYCIQDVEAEYALAQELPPLPKMERRIWELDQAINDRGILADLVSVEHAEAIIEEHSSKLQEELQELTGGAVGTAKQVAKMTSWMSENGCELDGLTKQDVKDALSGEIDPAVRRVLEIRQSLSMSSTAKLAAIRAFACRDGRLRGMFLYHGAGPGRWCMPGDAEVLTPEGWVPMENVHGFTPLMCWDFKGNKLTFLESVVSGFDYSGRMLKVESRFVSGLFTPEHKIPCITSRGYLDCQTAETFSKVRRGVPISGKYDPDIVRPEIETRLVVMTQADAHICTDKRSGRCVRFKFRKPRKVYRAELLLNIAGIPYTKRVYACGISIKIRWVDAPDYMKQAKLFTAEILQHNPTAFVDELKHWDGCIDPRSSAAGYSYTTTSKDNAEWVATMAHLAGWAATVSVRDRAIENWNTAYRVHIRKKEKTRVQVSESEWVDYEGKVYCPETPTGFFLVRYKGKIHITGNSGKGPQPQNFPRGNESLSPEAILDVWLPRRDSEWIELLWSDPMDAISSCLRGLFIASPGKDLVAADYSAIEARGLAFLAGEETVLEAFRNKLDLYKVAASGIYKKPYDQIGKKERQVGKTCVLACGYGGSKGAMLAFGADRFGMSDEEIDSAVAAWRESNPNIVRFWYALTEACLKTVKEGVETRYRQIGFRMRGKFLQMILPSGRPLWYYAPRVQQVRMPWGKDKEMVTAMTVDSMTKQWVRRPLGHPILSENATQAFCRDLLALGLIRCEAAGYKVVGHVHDEIVAEVPEGWGSVEEMEAIMSEVPKWAEGMPISAEGYRARRYRK